MVRNAQNPAFCVREASQERQVRKGNIGHSNSERTTLRPLSRQPQCHRRVNPSHPFVPTGNIAPRQALLSLLEHVNGETIGVNLASHVGPKAIHLIALDIFDGHQWSS
jgi:hypothetical protein